MSKSNSLFDSKWTKVVLTVLFIQLNCVSCGYVLTPKHATKVLMDLKRDFDMNFGFQLKKMGIVQSIKRSSNTTRKCYGDLGCLEITEDWFGLTRPVNVMPQDREEINTQFYLRTREKPKGEFLTLTSPATVSQSRFNASRPTKVIIHGFIDSGFVPWVKEMSEAFLAIGDFNVIAVDWGGGSASLYSQSAANTRLVGLEVAYLINYLKVHFKASPETFHLIGHSLGAHISGYVGEKLAALESEGRGGGQLGRISALDPAEPLFQSMPKFVRLDPGDATFVDAIHTDAKSILMLGYGMVDPVGHVDFYPNGGKDQPGCSLMDLPFSFDMADVDKTADSVGRHLVACSHTRAIELYIESLKSRDCLFIGHRCDSYEDFKKGLCFDCGANNQNCAILGYRAAEYFPTVVEEKAENVKFYFDTAKSAPFCQFHYLVELNLGYPPEAERWVQGYLKINLYGSKAEQTGIDLTSELSQRLNHGNQSSQVLAFSRNLGRVELCSVEWRYDHEIDPLDLRKVCVLMCADDLYVKSVKIASAHSRSKDHSLTVKTHRAVVCGNSEDDDVTRIQSGEWKMFYKPCAV